MLQVVTLIHFTCLYQKQQQILQQLQVQQLQLLQLQQQQH